LRKWKANKKNENKAAREKSGRKWRAYYYYLQSLSFTNTNLWNENTRNLSPFSHKISLHTCKYLLCPASSSTSTSMGVWDLRFFTQVLVLVASTQVWGAISIPNLVTLPPKQWKLSTGPWKAPQ
jgi:hypothetical protein